MYQALTEPRTIRLLRVVDCGPHLAHSLTLGLSTHRLVDLDFEPDGDLTRGYDALSYTWGAPMSGIQSEQEYSVANSVRVRIIVEKEANEVCIGRNLFEALTHIWNLRCPRKIWVDALCINQEDAAERSHQVAMMGDIYSQARQVLVWFGPEDPEDPGFRHLKWIHTTFLDKLHVWESEYGKWDDFLRFGPEYDEIIVDEDEGVVVTKDAVRALHKFWATRRYLRRAWIVQELALAQDPVAILGDSLVPMSNFVTVAGRLYEVPMAAIFVREDLGENDGSGAELRTIANLANSVADEATLRRAGQVTTFTDLGAFDESSRYWSAWYELLSIGHQPQSQDPRDAIYSLLGVVHALTPPDTVANAIQPDYRQPVEEVYQDFTMRMLQSMPYRTALSLVGRRGSSTLSATLPSWVPDYSTFKESGGVDVQTLVLYSSRGEALPKFSATGSTDLEHKDLDIDGRKLSVFARRAGQVTCTYQLQPRTHRVDDPQQAAVLHHLKTLDILLWALKSSLNMKYQRYPTGETVTQAIFRILGFHDHKYDDPEASFIYKMRNLLANAITGCRNLLNTVPESTLTQELDRTHSEMLGLLKDEPGIPTERYIALRKAASDRLTAVTDDDVLGMTRVQRRDDVDILKTLIDSPRNSLETRWIPGVSVLFETSSGHLGRVSNDIQAGDEVWLLCQAACPFVLRPVGEKGQGEYHLIGEAFIPGAMYGELVESGIAEEVRRIVIV